MHGQLSLQHQPLSVTAMHLPADSTKKMCDVLLLMPAQYNKQHGSYRAQHLNHPI